MNSSGSGRFRGLLMLACVLILLALILGVAGLEPPQDHEWLMLEDVDRGYAELCEASGEWTPIGECVE